MGCSSSSAEPPTEPRSFLPKPSPEPRSEEKVEIECAHCLQTLVFGSAPGVHPITCPYNNCGKRFQRTDCPHCYKINIWKNADYTPGSSTTCWNCKKNYSAVTCAHCDRIVVRSTKDCSFKDGNVWSCPYADCNGQSAYMDCPHCSKNLSYTNGSSFNDGGIIRCCHKGCKKDFSRTCCPHCSRVVEHSSGKIRSFKDGEVTRCPYKDCKRFFAMCSCPHCLQTVVRSRGRVLSFCDGNVNTCPYEDCQKRFAQVSCPHCTRTMFYYKNGGIGGFNDGQPHTCPFDDCRKSFQQVFCPHCNRTNSFLDSVADQSRCSCCNCKKSFTFVRHQAHISKFDIKPGPGTREVYHLTTAGEEIGQSGEMLRGNKGCVGPGIYFAATRAECEGKALSKGWTLKARIYTGKAKIIHKEDLPQQISYRQLRKEGFDSVEVRGFNSGTEYVVYSKEQVQILEDFQD